MYLKLGASLKLQWKKVIILSAPPPSSDDIIYEQPLLNTICIPARQLQETRAMLELSW